MLSQILGRDKRLASGGDAAYHGLNPPDVSIANLDNDVTVPQPKPLAVSSAAASSDRNIIRLSFAEALDPVSASVVANYTLEINGQVVAIESATYNSTLRLVAIVPATELRDGDLITGSFNNVLDAQGTPRKGPYDLAVLKGA